MLYSAFARRYLDVDSQSGDDWQCLCPFHRDKRPSFNFNVRRGVFICYACGERGGIEKLMEHMAIRQVPDPSLEDVQSALEKLKPEKEARTYPELWLERFKIDWRRDVRAVEHLNGRHLKRELIEQWGIGYEAATDSITIPIRNRDGALIGVYRRHSRPTRNSDTSTPSASVRRRISLGSASVNANAPSWCAKGHSMRCRSGTSAIRQWRCMDRTCLRIRSSSYLGCHHP